MDMETNPSTFLALEWDNFRVTELLDGFGDPVTQTAWLDKILELAIEAGLIEVA